MFALLMLLAGCGEPIPRFRYKITVEVMTPEGVRSGVAVREVSATRSDFPSQGSIYTHITGEAVAIDLPGGRTLFALLLGRDAPPGLSFYEQKPYIFGAADQVFWTLAPAAGLKISGIGAVKYEDAARVFAANRYQTELDPRSYPLLVRFRDIADPTSVEKVDPANLAASFGPGYALRRVTIELTKDPVTHTIEKRLGWLGTAVTGYLDGQFSGGGPALSNILDTTAFKMGE